MLNLYLHDKLREESRQVLLHEVEQQRLVARSLGYHAPLGRRTIGKLGRGLITVGARLERLERREQPNFQAL